MTHAEKYVMERDFAFTNSILSKGFSDCKINYLKMLEYFWNFVGKQIVSNYSVDYLDQLLLDQLEKSFSCLHCLHC